jgi:DNA-binding PadR family transcriptional regulator
MDRSKFSDSELLILGLIAEMPRHGYELEGVIEERGMREWTRIGFSSIYYVLGKLEESGLITAEEPTNPKARKRFEITEKGKETLVKQTLFTLKTVQPTYPSLLLGMIHLAVLSRDQVLDALKTRKNAVALERKRMERIHFEQQPLPDYIDAIFEFSIGQLLAEADWIDRTLDYMKTKAWIT